MSAQSLRADVMGPAYPSETFRVLKNREIKEYGEYRTARLVLAAHSILLALRVDQIQSGAVLDNAAAGYVVQRS